MIAFASDAVVNKTKPRLWEKLYEAIKSSPLLENSALQCSPLLSFSSITYANQTVTALSALVLMPMSKRTQLY